MDSSKDIVPLIPWALSKEKIIRTSNLDFPVFCDQNVKLFTGCNSVSLAVPEWLTNTWNNHCNPIKIKCNGNKVHYSSK